MIRFELASKPAGFEDTEIAGAAWLLANSSAQRPRDLWSGFKPALADAFRNLCAYSAMFEPVGTVDHFVSFHEDRARAYDWSNYRYASAWINSSKQALRSEQVVDPFEVVDDWFEILLPSLQLVTTSNIPDLWRQRAEFVLHRLHLRDDERVLRQRREWYRMYQAGDLTLQGLASKAPLIARAVQKMESR